MTVAAVLDLRFDKFESIIRWLASSLNFMSVLDTEGASECAGADNYLFRWVFTVLFFPGGLIGVVLADYFLNPKRKESEEDARKDLKANLFFVVFFCCESIFCSCCKER